jgi:sugar phosphate isomerase/epimerase
MIKSAVTISLVPEARGGPFVFWDDLADGCRKAASLGFDAVEVFPRGAHGVDAAELRRLLDGHGLKLAAMGTGAGWVLHKFSLTDTNPVVAGKAHDFIRSIVDLAGSFGAPAVVGSMQGRWDTRRDEYLRHLELLPKLQDLARHARQYSVPLLLEPLNRYETNIANTLADAAALVRRLGDENIKLLADLFHMNIEEADMAASIRAAGPMVGHVHFADSNRRPVGLGHTDNAPVVAALRDIGYDGYVSAECLPYPDPDAAARQTMTSFRKFFR